MLTPTTLTEEELAALFLSSIAITLGATIGIYCILLKVEAQIAADMLNSYAEDASNVELSVEDSKQKDCTSIDFRSKKQLQLEAEIANMSCSATDFDPQQNSYASVHNDGMPTSNKNTLNDIEIEGSSQSMSSFSSITLRISHFRKMILALLTVVLILLNYLLMVLSSASDFLSFLGLALISVLVLQRHILEEVRSNRYERLACLVSFMLITTMSMNLASYAAKEVATENMYQGPARIVGYDTSNYDELKAGKETTNTKTDLEVAWGYQWACPLSPDKECRAVVDGALCEMDDNSTLWDDDDYAGSDTNDTKFTTEVYYDENGKKVEKENDHETDYNENGKVVEDYKAHETTEFNENGGNVENYEEDSTDTEYNSNGNVKDVWSTKQSANYTDEGDVGTGTYEYKDSEYSKGALVDVYDEEEDEDFQTASGGHENIDHSLDVSFNADGSTEGKEYTDMETEIDDMGETDTDDTLDVSFNLDGSVEEEDYTKSETELDAAGKITDEYDKEIAIVNDKNGNLENKIVDEDEEKYKDGKAEEETINIVDITENSDGTKEHKDKNKTIKFNKDGEYNVTLDVESNDNGGGNRTLHRRLEDQADSTSEGSNNKQQLEDELEEKEEENERLKDEIDELRKKNEDLQNELAKEKGENKPEHEDDDWGETDWGSVWGEYECYNLFDADLEGVEFNTRKPPGSDDWPYLNIYGNCQTCEAYIVDYYSTEHFQSIQSYKQASLNFGIAACFSLLLTVALALKRRFNPKENNKIDFLESSSKMGTFS